VVATASFRCRLLSVRREATSWWFQRRYGAFVEVGCEREWGWAQSLEKGQGGQVDRTPGWAWRHAPPYAQCVRKMERSAAGTSLRTPQAPLSPGSSHRCLVSRGPSQNQQGFQEGPYNSTGISPGPLKSIRDFNRVLKTQQGFHLAPRVLFHMGHAVAT
jgi:hypothetical protein